MTVPTVNNTIIKAVAPEITHPLRQSVLRPSQAIDEMVYPGDDAAGTLHLAVTDSSGTALAIASFYIEPHPVTPGQGDWRLRGMAVQPALQGKGMGARLLNAGIERIREQAGRRLWCNARIPARRFYERLGFTAEGEVFEIKPVGMHYVMSIDVNRSGG